MNVTNPDVQQLDQQWLASRGLDQALIYYWDHIDVVHESPISPAEIDLATVMEGYWFGEHASLHMYRISDDWHTVCVQEDEACVYMDECLLIDHRRRKKWGTHLYVRQYLEEDKDGQYYVSYVRPLRLIHEGNREG